jgi:hypothetical protein
MGGQGEFPLRHIPLSLELLPKPALRSRGGGVGAPCQLRIALRPCGSRRFAGERCNVTYTDPLPEISLDGTSETAGRAGRIADSVPGRHYV